MKDSEFITKFVVASKNKDKMIEIREVLKEFPFQIMSMEEAGIDDEIEEDGTSFSENALIKALAVHRQTGGFVMADDSGLCIDALDGAPGIFSARFHGKNSTYAEKIQALWNLLAEVPTSQRSAHFICAIAVVCPDGSHFTVQETMDGIICDQMIGDNGFGYDPIFYLPELRLTSAQLTSEEKNKISHRGKALQAMLALLRHTWYSFS